MTLRTSVDFVDGDRIAVGDRGFTYGDGLFETLRVVAGKMPLWSRHAARLTAGCRRLGMPVPDASAIHAEVARLSQGLSDAVARVTVSRGEGPRGYAWPVPQTPTVVITVSPLQLDADGCTRGVAVRLCDIRLARQPVLAGMKHLNRLEQVMARAEWSDPAVGEGLMMDSDGHVVCATAANLFAVIDGMLVTPPVDVCGVAGVARAEILATHHVSVAPMNLARLESADEVFLTSAVRGILPVRVLASRTWQPGPVARALQAYWRSIGLPLPETNGFPS